MALKQGDKVMVYQDPITQQNPEGEAVLLQKEIDDLADGLEYWQVSFEGDEGVYARVINTVKPVK